MMIGAVRFVKAEKSQFKPDEVNERKRQLTLSLNIYAAFADIKYNVSNERHGV